MGAVVVEVGPPRSDQIVGVTQAVEQVLVQTLIPHPAIDALDEPVLHWLARCDVVPINFAVFLPLHSVPRHYTFQKSVYDGLKRK